MATDVNVKRSLVCDLSAIDVKGRIRHGIVVAQMRSAQADMKMLINGYALAFARDSKNLMLLAEFISREQQCCPFLDFTIKAHSGGEWLWLEMTGPDGTEMFLKDEFGLA